MNIIRKGISLFLIILCLLTVLTSCEGDGYYAPIESDAKNNTVIAHVGDEAIRYELLRFYFMHEHEKYDGGDSSVWSGENGQALFEQAMADILPDICEIYATFAVCRQYGIDPYSDAIDEEVNKYVKADIDGGNILGQPIEGYGTVEAYQAALSARYLTDAVNRLIYRYTAVLTALQDYIAAYGDGDIVVTDEELSNFFYGEDCARVNLVFISFESQGGSREEARARIEAIHEDMLSATSYDELIRVGFINSTTVPSYDELENGFYIGRHSTDNTYSEELAAAAFSLPAGQISDIIETRDGYYILYGMSKDTSDLTERKDFLMNLYLTDRYYADIDRTAGEYMEGIRYTNDYHRLTGASFFS